MNNIADKIKQAFSTNFGKLAGIISVLSFIITLVLSVLYKNRIDVSLLKAIISGVITIVILFLLGIVLKKYLGESIIEESTESGSNEIDYNAIYDGGNPDTSLENTDTGENNNNNISPSTEFNPDNIQISDIPNPIALDKNVKQNYSSSGDDIGDIVFGKPAASSTASSANYSTSASSMFPDKKVNNEEIMKEVHEDPEKVAKAVRTMIAKDEKEDK